MKPGLKGVYKLNPTKAIMKQGSKAARAAQGNANKRKTGPSAKRKTK